MTNLVRLLDDMSGAAFCGLDTLIQVPLLKGREGNRNPHYGRVTKRHDRARVMVFTNQRSNGYANMVRRRLEAVGKDPDTFQLHPRRWGTRVPEFPIVEHLGNHYFEVIYLQPGTSTYYLDGQPIDKAAIIGLPQHHVSEDAQGGLGEFPDKLVQLRDYKLTSLVQIRIDQLNVVGPFHFTA